MHRGKLIGGITATVAAHVHSNYIQDIIRKGQSC